MYVTACHSLSGLAALPVELIGKKRIFIAEKEFILPPSIPSLAQSDHSNET